MLEGCTLCEETPYYDVLEVYTCLKGARYTNKRFHYDVLRKIFNKSDHFYSSVSHPQGWAHRALHNTYLLFKSAFIPASVT